MGRDITVVSRHRHSQNVEIRSIVSSANRVDMSTGKEVDMGSQFDWFGIESHPDYRGITEEQYNNRMFLRNAMLRNGFVPIDCEWWHFTLADEPYPDLYFSFPVSMDSIRS